MNKHTTQLAESMIRNRKKRKIFVATKKFFLFLFMPFQHFYSYEMCERWRKREGEQERKCRIISNGNDFCLTNDKCDNLQIDISTMFSRILYEIDEKKE